MHVASGQHTSAEKTTGECRMRRRRHGGVATWWLLHVGDEVRAVAAVGPAAHSRRSRRIPMKKLPSSPCSPTTMHSTAGTTRRSDSLGESGPNERAPQSESA